MRNQDWLQYRFDKIWELFFPSIPKKNVYVTFKGKWKYKFGHIKKTRKGTEIAINSLFQDIRVPEYIIQITLAHEIVHYMHGFFSNLPRMYKYPHKGNIINKELTKRGFNYLLKQQKTWIKEEWLNLYNELRNKR
jgi:hypothetical protein